MGIALAVACSLAFAGLDATRKELLRTYSPLSLLAVLSLCQSILYGVWVWADGWAISWSEYAWVLAALVILQTAANLLLMKALEISELGRVIPFLSLTPVLTGLSGMLGLDQQPEAEQWVGIGLVTIGSVGLAARRNAEGRLGVDRGSAMAMTVAVIWSITAALDKLAIDASAPAAHAWMQSTLMGAGLALFLVVRRRRLLPPAPRLGVLGASIALGSLALAMQLLAIQLVWVSVVETLKRGLGAVLALAVGRLRFKEPITLSKLLAVAAIVTGTSLTLLN